MYLFKTSGATLESVVRNQLHAFCGMPQDWRVGELILVSKNRLDCRPDEKQVQYIMLLRNVREICDGEAEMYWPGNEGRWKYIVECDATKRLSRSFDLHEALLSKKAAAFYKPVVSFARLFPEHEMSVVRFLDLTQPEILDGLLKRQR